LSLKLSVKGGEERYDSITQSGYIPAWSLRGTRRERYNLREVREGGRGGGSPYYIQVKSDMEGKERRIKSILKE